MTRVFPLPSLWIFVFFAVLQSGCSQPDPLLLCLEAGDTYLYMDYSGNPASEVVWVNLHHNEQTSVQAAQQLLTPEYPVRYLGIQNQQRRNLVFNSFGSTIEVDPNRIFTVEGIEKSLRNFGAPTAQKIEITQHVGKQLTEVMLPARLIVSLHNSADSGLAVTSFVEGALYAATAAKTYVNLQHDTDDFFLVTNQKAFDYFARKGYNVVLQNNQTQEDDGSLSVYCGRNQIDYINVECQHGHLTEQVAMLREVIRYSQAQGYVVKPKEQAAAVLPEAQLLNKMDVHAYALILDNTQPFSPTAATNNEWVQTVTQNLRTQYRIPKENIQVLQQPTLEQAQKALDRLGFLGKHLGKRATLVVYYKGAAKATSRHGLAFPIKAGLTQPDTFLYVNDCVNKITAWPTRHTHWLMDLEKESIRNPKAQTRLIKADLPPHALLVQYTTPGANQSVTQWIPDDEKTVEAWQKAIKQNKVTPPGRITLFMGAPLK